MSDFGECFAPLPCFAWMPQVHIHFLDSILPLLVLLRLASLLACTRRGALKLPRRLCNPESVSHKTNASAHPQSANLSPMPQKCTAHMSRICPAYAKWCGFNCQCICTAIWAFSCMPSQSCVECISTATSRLPHVWTHRCPDVHHVKPCKRADVQTSTRAGVLRCRMSKHPDVQTITNVQTY